MTNAEDTFPQEALPPDYLAGGYYAVTENGVPYLHPELVGTQAKEIADKLPGMRSTDFLRLIQELKRSNKRTLPFEAKQTAVLELLPKALSLVHRKKAPPLLVEFARKNIDAIHTTSDYQAFLRHCEAIFGYLSIKL